MMGPLDFCQEAFVVRDSRATIWHARGQIDGNERGGFSRNQIRQPELSSSRC